MRSLLVTNDFPPKLGGIQSYLWELWRRLPAGDVGVMTTPHHESASFDAAQAYPVVRVDEGLMLPTRSLARRIREQAATWGVEVLFLDPALPVGFLGPRLGLPYVVVAHGAEITVYRRLPVTRCAMRRVLRRAAGVVAAGGFPARECLAAAGRELDGLVIPPGVDTERFRPLDEEQRSTIRRRHGLDTDRPLVLGVSRLVPRKGFDVLIDAVARIEGVQLAIAGDGRDRGRLERRASERGLTGRVTFLGRVGDEALPGLYAAADVFAMPCRERWGGLEQEGFGIVFLEAAACGIAAVAGSSGGAQEAVVDGETGFVVPPRDRTALEGRLRELLEDAGLRRRMGARARERVTERFTYDRLVERLRPVAAGDLGSLERLDPSRAR